MEVTREFRIATVALAVVVFAMVALFALPSISESDAETYDGEQTFYGYKLGMGINEPNQTSTVEWDFGDGSPTEIVAITEENPQGMTSHTYSEKGDYVVKATARNKYTDPDTGEDKDGEFTKIYLIHIMGYPVVTFDANGGEGAPETILGEKSSYVISEPTGKPTKPGHVFTGWYVDQVTTELFDWSSEVAKHITLYAGWEESAVPSFTVTYDGNGGESARGSDTVPEGSVVKLPDVTRDGYRALGWFDGNMWVGNPGGEYTVNGDVTLKVKWISENPVDWLWVFALFLTIISLVLLLYTGDFYWGIPAALFGVLTALMLAGVI